MKRTFSLLLSVFLLLGTLTFSPRAYAAELTDVPVSGTELVSPAPPSVWDTLTEPQAVLAGGTLGSDLDENDTALVDFIRSYSGSEAETYDKNQDMYIEYYDVDMVVTDKRTVSVTESILAVFNNPMHGFVRSIPSSGSEESYRITNVRAQSEQNVRIDHSADGVMIRFGSGDMLGTGSMLYQIFYDIEYFGDVTEGKDMLIQNIFPNKLTCSVIDPTARIHLPENAQLLDASFLMGQTDMKESDSIHTFQAGNTLYLYCDRSFLAGEGALTQLTFPDGFFRQPDAAINVSGYTAELKIEKNGSYTYTQTMNASFSRDEVVMPVWERISVQSGGELSGVKTVMTVDGRKVDSFDGEADYRLVHLNKAGGSVQEVVSVQKGKLPVSDTPGYELRAQITPTGGNKTGNADIVCYEDMKISVSCPSVNGESGIEQQSYKVQTGGSSFDTETNENGAFAVLHGKLPAGESVTVDFKLRPGAGKNVTGGLDIALYVLSALPVLVLVIFFLIKKRNKVTPTMEHQPPEGMNPAEVGYIIDNTVDDTDLTSLIYYWASHGHLKIQVTSDDTYTLHRINRLDDAHTDYEQAMFNNLWALGTGTCVRSLQLENGYHETLSQAGSYLKNAVFVGERKLINSGSVIRSRVLAYCTVILSVIVHLIADIMEKGVAFSPFAAVNLASLALIYPMRLARLSYNNRIKNKTRSVWQGILAVLLGGVGSWLYLITFNRFTFGFVPRAVYTASTLVTVLLSARLSSYTEYGAAVLGKCQGFKNFLKSAEKDRLEMLLEENPEYYFDILPYAQVLGVSKIWAEKFESLKSVAPGWFYGPDVEANTARLHALAQITRLNRRVRSASKRMKVRTVTRSGGGGFSGGGGGGGGAW